MSNKPCVNDPVLATHQRHIDERFELEQAYIDKRYAIEAKFAKREQWGIVAVHGLTITLLWVGRGLITGVWF